MSQLSLLELMIEARKLVVKADTSHAHTYLCLALESFDASVPNTDDETQEKIDLLIRWIRMQLGGCYTFESYFDSHYQHLRYERLQWIDAMIQHLRLNDELNEKTLDADILGSMVMSGELFGPAIRTGE